MAKNAQSTDPIIVAIPPFHYIHVLDKNTNVTRSINGPVTFVRKDHESVVKQPERMITVSKKQYCVVRNPIKKLLGTVAVDENGQVDLDFGEEEYRFAQPPFPLYPGEMLLNDLKDLTVLSPNDALVLKADIGFTSENGVQRVPGEVWLLEGPGVYYPRKEVSLVEARKAEMIAKNTALRLRARMDFTDKNGTARVFGEEWLIKERGSYMIEAKEEKVAVVEAHFLDEKHALHVCAVNTHVDDFGKRRRHGEEWLITHKDTESHIPSVNEKVKQTVSPIILSSTNFCVICDPIGDDGAPRIGKKLLVRGEKSFFLLPGESLHGGIENVYVLSEKEGIILRANESFQDGDKSRIAGEDWMLLGPLEYVPPIEVEVVTVRQAIPLDENEGIYVRDKLSGHVRSVTGSTYMLKENEELWSKKLPSEVQQILQSNLDPLADRSTSQNRSKDASLEWDATRVVTYRVPHNSAVQIYDYKGKRARIVFGPERVMLDPDEQFTLLSLSGGKPKQPNQIKAICLLLGPDFCTDVLVIETADHARLSIQLSYNWHFQLTPERTQAECEKLFALPDFVGDFCKAIAARVRGAVASVNFDVFHKNSAMLIRRAVFGSDNEGNVGDKLIFPQNNLVVTSVDVQSVEPVDQRTRDALQKSVQLAIEITSNSQEAAARHEAERLEQESRGKLERQRIKDEAIAEEARKGLLELQIQLAALESTGQAKAEAQSQAESALITCQSAVERARLEAEAEGIRAEAEINRLKVAREAELEYLSKKNELELSRRKEEMDVETTFYLKRVEAIGSDNLRLIACAAPDRDVKMLRALNLKSTLITDGRTPVNLLDATSGLIGQTSNAIHGGVGRGFQGDSELE